MLGVNYKDESGNMLLPGQIMRQISKNVKGGADVEHLMNFAEEMSGEKINAQTRRKLNSFIDQTLKNEGKIGSADLLKMMSMLGGSEHMGKILAAALGDWDALEAKMNDVHGAAEKMSDIQLDNLSGDVTKLTSAWDGFQRGLFEGQAGEGLRSFVQSLTEMVGHANKLFSDGIQIGDFGKIIGDVFGRLKNKLLEFDGVGSILAGGALMAGLLKIGSTAQRVIGYFRQLRGLEIGQRTGTTSTTARGLSGGQSVGTMNISAGVVNVNGKVAGVNGSRRVGNQTIIDNYNRTRDRIRGTPPTISPFAGMRSAAMGGAAMAGIFGVMDVMNVRSQSQERLAAAKSDVQAAQKAYNEQLQGGASPQVLAEYAAAIQAAQAQQAQVLRENQAAEFKAGSEATGAILGTALGAAVGSIAGPVGTTIGGIIGGIIGEKLGGLAADIKGEPQTPAQKRNFFTGEGMDEPQTPARHEEHLPAPSVAEFRKPEIHAEQRRLEMSKTLENFKAIDKKLAETGQALHFDTNQAAFDYYAQQREQFANIKPLELPSLGDFFSGLFGHAEAAELNPTQLAQQEAMERGEFVPPETEPIQPPEIDTEALSFNLESIGEVFGNLRESIGEQLSSAFEGVGEIFSGLSESIGESLSSAFEGVGEIFSGLGETIGAGFEGVIEAATSSLEGVQNAFTTAKESICAAWNELPSFFSGVFSGLGGAAEAAGSAILSGLTSVCGAVISAWQSVAATVSSIISTISAAASTVAGMIPSFGGGTKAYAEGGFVDSPTFLVGEAGGEVVIPLSSSKRARALDLFEKTRAILGGEAVNFGGDELQSETPEFSEDFGLPNTAGLSSETTITTQNQTSTSANSFNLGGFNVTFEISGADSPQEIMQTIKENLADLTDKIAAQLAKTVGATFENQPLEA